MNQFSYKIHMFVSESLVKARVNVTLKSSQDILGNEEYLITRIELTNPRYDHVIVKK